MFTLPPGAQFTILTNATGHFRNLPEGGIILAGDNFRISYVGGDGNDVVLIHDDAPELTPPICPRSTKMRGS